MAPRYVYLQLTVCLKFDGDYSQWSIFNDLFSAIVGSNEVGKAAREMQHLEDCNDEYQASLELLWKFFENKKAIYWNYENFIAPIARGARLIMDALALKLNSGVYFDFTKVSNIRLFASEIYTQVDRYFF